MKLNFSRIVGMIIGLVLVYFVITSLSSKDDSLDIEINVNNTEIKDNLRDIINFNDYNYQFAEGSVLGVLDSLIGSNRAVLHLPSTKYINVSSGDSFGIAFAIQNVLNTGENYFEYSFEPADSTLVDCEVSEEEARSWIVTGQKSFGKITGDWVDKMSVYFEFPDNVNCKATYDFKVIKDGEIYYTDKVEFNIN